MARGKKDGKSLAEGDRVVVDVELPGVSAGSQGRIVGSSGLDWIRYRVRFDNGVVRNLIDGSHLQRAAQ